MAKNCLVCQETLSESDAVVDLGQERLCHAPCFACFLCLEPLEGAEFYATKDDGAATELLLCKDDWFKTNGDRCASKLCGAVIQGKIISAIGLKWHEPHFVCRSCGCVLSSTTSSFICKFSHPLCLNCNNKLKSFAAFENSKIECAKCNRPIDNQAKEMITYKNQVVHAYHFECFVCGSLLDASCKEVDGRLVCAADALGENKGNCQKCGKMVRGERSFVALGGVFHIECFTCTKCEKPFTSSAFWEYKSKPFCEEHYNQLMGSICGFCNEVSSGRVVTAIGKKWCEDHFFCHGCHCSLVASKFISWDLKPMCKKCFEALPRGVREILHKREEAEKKQHFRN